MADALLALIAFDGTRMRHGGIDPHSLHQARSGTRISGGILPEPRHAAESETMTNGGDSHHESTRMRTGVLLSEYSFVSALIPLYRGFQVQAVGLAMVLYSAILGTAAASASQPDWRDTVLRYSTCLSPYLVALIVTSFGVMELRVRRANQYISHTLRPAVRTLAGYGPTDKEDLLAFGAGDAQHMTSFEERMSNSAVFILIISGPSTVAASWFMLSDSEKDVRWIVAAGVGLVTLVAASAFALTVSARKPSSEHR